MNSREKNLKEDKSYLGYLLKLGRTLNSSLQQDKVLNIAIDSVVDFVEAERGFIMLLDDTGELRVKAYKNVDIDSVKELVGISKSILNAAAVEGEDIISVNAQRDPRFSKFKSVELTGMRSVLCVPLKVKNKIIGIIYLDNKIENMFNDSHLSMLSAFANQAAVAIENARLHESLIKSYDERLKLARELHKNEKIRFACEEANRQKSDFVNIVSHELRSPLTVIKTYTSMLERDSKMGRNSIKENMKIDIYQTVDTEVDRLLSMINKLLDVSRMDARKPLMPHLKSVDVYVMINHVLKLQKTSKFFKEGKHEILLDIPKDLPNIICDKEKISQVLMNLLENALKYSPDGGYIRIKVVIEGDFISFSISDEGMGITPKDQKRLFKKFERIDNDNRSIPGTGLGLYLIKNLVEIQGGKISVFSNIGKGSVFTFRIPIEVKVN